MTLASTLEPGGSAGYIALLIIVLLFIATALLVRNMSGRLKRLPREFDAASPRADLLTLKTLFAVQEHEPQEWLHTPEVVDRVTRAWRALAPLNEWLRTHVGPPRTT